jgi:hypothetical protein
LKFFRAVATALLFNTTQKTFSRQGIFKNNKGFIIFFHSIERLKILTKLEIDICKKY